MNLFKKYILFSLITLLKTTSESAYLFKNSSGEARIINPYDITEFKNIDYPNINKDELFVVIDQNNHAKLTFFEQKPNGKYLVYSFTIQNPSISAEFSNEKDAQDFLYNFIIQPTIQKPFYIPTRKRNKNYDWRKVPYTPRRR